MEVTSSAFYSNLSNMLQKLVGCSFVAIDLEFSGVPEVGDVRKISTLQQRYEEVKKTVGEYSVVQLGFTIVHKNQTTGGFVAFPYNLKLSPLISEKLDIDRTLALQGRALSFLLEHGFDLQGLVKNGVPYLSRREAEKAKSREIEALDKTEVPDIVLREDETDLRQFVEKMTAKLREWVASDPRSPELLLFHDAYVVTRATHTGLSGLERRLARQIIRSEFPDLEAQRCSGGLIVTIHNKERSTALKKRHVVATEERIQKQSGVRWFMEALCGAEQLKRADAVQFVQLASDQPILIDTDAAKATFTDLCNAIRETRPVLVGHNVFTDLVYLYRTFFGRLPDVVEDFISLIHELFPRIVDTKFLATSKNFRRRSSSLADVAREYAAQALPAVDITDDLAFVKYQGASYPHEAGYDSFVTARVLVKMSAYLASVDGYVPKVDLPPPDSPKSETSDLIDLSDAPKPQGSMNTLGDAARSENMVMPDWESSFWTEYGNRLRVYGTEEAEVHLGKFEKPPT